MCLKVDMFAHVSALALFVSEIKPAEEDEEIQGEVDKFAVHRYNIPQLTD